MSANEIRSGHMISLDSSARRRALALGAIALAAPLGTLAQQPKKLWRIGFIAIGARPPSLQSHALGGFARGMRELGYIEGQDYIVEWRFPEGKQEAFTSGAAELAQMKVDFIIAATGTGIDAARKATSTIPIIMVNVADPVGAGLIKSLARPGGNLTGMSNQTGETISKHPEFLRIAIPSLSGIAVLHNPNSVSSPLFLKQIQASATTLGLKVRLLDVRAVADLDGVFDALKKERVRALIVTPDPLLSTHSRRVTEFARDHRIATMFWTRQHVEAGGLMSYGQNNGAHYHRAAYYIDKIIKGAKPAELPVEQGTHIELVLNLKTAKAIGLTMPKELLFRAETVIE